MSGKKQKKLRKSVLKKRLKFAKIGFYVAAFVLLFGILAGLFTNINRYPDGDTATVTATIVSATAQTDMQEQENAVVSVVRYHLVGDFMYKDSNHRVTLDESYSTQAFADKKIGETREIVIDTKTFDELLKAPFNWTFIIFVIIGFIGIVITLLYAYRYSNIVPMFIQINKKSKEDVALDSVETTAQ